jgi:type IV secretory pathway VirB10-like protein
MDFIKAVSIIRKDLEEVSALLDQLAVTPGTNIAEIELARSRVHSAMDMLKLLPQLKQATVPQEANQALTAPSALAAAEVKAEVKPEAKDEGKTEVKPEMKPEAKHGVKPEAGPEAKPEEKAAASPEAKPEVKAEAAAEKGKPILADRFSAAETIGKKVSSVKQDDVITSVMHNKPISDIGAAIGINDKFYFIRELFSGDTRAYQDTIKRLNSSASLGEAMKILDENTVMGSDPGAQSSFVDIVRRKFNINV